MSDGGSGSGGSGFNWGLRPSGGSDEPVVPEPVVPEPAPAPIAPEPVAPEPAAPEPVAPEPAAPEPDPAPQPAPWETATQLIPQTEQHDPLTQPFAPEPPAFTTELAGPPAPAGEPDSALDALFGEAQFRDYDTGVLNPTESPFAARGAQADPESPDGGGRVGISRNQKVLMSVAGGLLGILALVALFFVGTRLPAVFAHKPAPPLSSPSSAPSPTSTAKPVGPIANGVHPWTALLGGECLDPYTSPWADKFTVVDCAKPHPAQMVFRGTFDTSTDPSYPGADKLQSQISLLCAAPGVINLAAAGVYSDAQLQGSYAVNADEWADGEHDYFCFVSRSSGQPLTGSVAVPPPAPATPAP